MSDSTSAALTAWLAEHPVELTPWERRINEAAFEHGPRTDDGDPFGHGAKYEAARWENQAERQAANNA